MDEADAVPVRALKRAFETLEALKDVGEAGVTELADRTDQPKSTVHNHLRTLGQLGYVVNQEGRYRLSLRFLDFGHSRRSDMAIFEKGREHVDDLAEQSGDLANLLVEERGRGVYLYQARGPDAVNLDTYAGKRVALHSTALGKAILAHLPAGRVDRIVDRHGLPPVTERTITDRSEMDRELAEIRERGQAFDEGERHEGINCVAAPITDGEERVRGAVSVTAPTSRMDETRFREDLPDLVTNAATLIEINMTYS